MKKQSGITLIALVITIVVLIILAVVSINLAIGRNGLLNKSKDAKQKYEIAEAKEYIEVKVNECVIEKDGNATLQDIVDYLAEDSNVTYYVALEEIALVTGEIDVGTPKEIYVVYNRYQFKIDENKNVEFISIVEVNLDGQVTIEANVQEYLGKNEEENYTASILLKATTETEITKIEIQNPDGTVIMLETEGLTTMGKDMTIEFDKTYKVILTTSNGHKYTKKIIEKSEETIMTAEGLANFRDKVNSGLTYEGKTVKLGADIDLSTVCGKNVNGEEISWEAIGKGTQFKGTLDGNYHSISNLYINSTNANEGLFCKNYGYIQNIQIDGTINIADSSRGYAGGIAAQNRGDITNCVNNCNITAPQCVGGIVSHNYQTITNCANTGTITSYKESTCEDLGGIAANNTGIVQYCYNTGSIINTATKNYGYDAGGIVGQNSSEANTKKSLIENCYNAGKIITNNLERVGGITGWNLSVVNNCYNIGDVSGKNKVGSVVGSNNDIRIGTITKSYFLSTTYSKGVGLGAGETTSVSAETLKTYATTLGEAFTDDIQNKDGTWKYNNGYPILKWQLEEN